MKSTINQRLKEWLVFKKVSQAKFGETLGRKRGQVNNWCSGAAPIPDKIIIETIRLFTDLNARWFVTGEGEMAPGDDNRLNEPNHKYKTEHSCAICSEKEKQISLLEKMITILEGKKETLSKTGT